jgi:hypothetical protein
MNKRFTCAYCKAEFRSLGGLGNHARHSKPCTFEARFWARVEKRGLSECWPWKGRADTSGYGRVAKSGPNTYAHRIAWTLTNGKIAGGLDILHSCDVRECCNPAHMSLGTQVENNMDMWRKGRGGNNLQRASRTGDLK